jgi:circadian clock protein KaiC
MERHAEKNRDKSTEKKTIKIRKVATRIEGLDDILEGGFPAGMTTLISGGPGTGKSLIGLEFLYRGAVSGNPGIFLSFEEMGEDIRRNALTFGWDLASLEQAGRIFLMEGEVDPNFLLSGDFSLSGLLGIIEGQSKEMGADRIVIDAMDILMRFFDDPKRQKNEIFAFNKWLKDHRMTAVLTSKNTKEKNSSENAYLDFMADCVIYLDQRVTEQVSTKKLQVIKYRGSGYGGNEYPFIITEGGVNFYPITDLEMRYESDFQRISSGNASLDTFLGGGFQSGTCILVSGPTGTGKTCLVSTFVCSACGEGQRVLFVNFEEDLDGMLANMRSLGIHLSPAIKGSLLQFMSVMPESRGIEEHLFRIISAIQRFRPQHLVIDAISACKRIAGLSAAFDFLVRLVHTCKKEGITVIFTNQSTKSLEDHEISGIGISSIIDTIISLDYDKNGNDVFRILLIRKSRRTRHSNQYHNYILTDNGIKFDTTQPTESLSTD